jgi:C1A family cysteine protease
LQEQLFFSCFYHTTCFKRFDTFYKQKIQFQSIFFSIFAIIQTLITNIMKKLLPLMVLIVLAYNAFSQQKIQKAPLNADFVEYMNENFNKEDVRNGLVPAPFQVRFDNFYKTGHRKELSAIPNAYDLRDSNRVTSVKNQGNYGTCWTFSAMASIESRWLTLEGEKYDLSEKNLATCNGYLNGINEGGNSYMASAYMTRLDGPVSESDDPYYSLTDTSSCVSSYTPVDYATEVRFLPNDINEVKRAIMNYGAVATSMYSEPFSNSEYYNPDTYSWYYSGDKPSNHGVTIVGWDDNKVISGIPGSPDTEGAWIIKNSWGFSSGDNGYFYMAYEDTRVLNSNSIYPVKKQKEEIDSLYMYDKLGMVSSYGFQNDTAYALVKYEATTNEHITQIGSFINSYGTEVHIKVYDDFDTESQALTNLLDSVYNKNIMYPGYHTFDFNADVSDDFYIKIKYVTPNNNYPIPVEVAYSGYSDPVIQPVGFNWISKDGNQWTQLGSGTEDYQADLCIRAYTNRDAVQARFTNDKKFICLNDTVTFYNNSTGDIDSLHWDFGPGANPADTSLNDSIEVTFNSVGGKDVTMEAYKSGVRVDSITIQDAVIVEEDLHIFFSQDEIGIGMKTENVIKVHGEADEYIWEDQTGLDTTNGAFATLLYNGESETSFTYKVTGVTGSCSDSDSIKVTFSPVPPNDDVCNAAELSKGENGPFDNSNATVQTNEPMPDTTSCDGPLQWCAEGGLQHSVWFKFTMQDTGKVSFVSEGLDTQLALYEAEKCDDILSDKYTLLAANDDYFGEARDYAAAIMDYEGLTQGETYWLQMDGSAGGAVGEFTIEVKTASTAIDNIYSLDNSFNIFPNPTSQKKLNLEFDMESNTAELKIISVEGRMVLSKEINNIYSGKRMEIQLSDDIEPGVYFIQIQTNKGLGTQKLIVN